VAIQFFTNAPQRPRTNGHEHYNFLLSAARCVPLRWQFIQALTVPSLFLRWSNEITVHSMVPYHMAPAVRCVPSRCQFSHPNTDYSQYCLTLLTGQDRRSQRDTAEHNWEKVLTFCRSRQNNQLSQCMSRIIIYPDTIARFDDGEFQRRNIALGTHYHLNWKPFQTILRCVIVLSSNVCIWSH
jgi:hypothetical protein